jgi:hypothetical protein
VLLSFFGLDVPTLYDTVTNMPLEPREPEPLTRAGLMTAAGVDLLGKIAAGRLFETGSACLLLNQNGQVELVPLLELQLDAVTESEALKTLIQASYSESQLRDFLVARDRRTLPSCSNQAHQTAL